MCFLHSPHPGTPPFSALSSVLWNHYKSGHASLLPICSSYCSQSPAWKPDPASGHLPPCLLATGADSQHLEPIRVPSQGGLPTVQWASDQSHSAFQLVLYSGPVLTISKASIVRCSLASNPLGVPQVLLDGSHNSQPICQPPTPAPLFPGSQSVSSSTQMAP